jgi:hypothetical protein
MMKLETGLPIPKTNREVYVRYRRKQGLEKGVRRRKECRRVTDCTESRVRTGQE